MKSIELFVPGRLCLFGEHSDWAGGYRIKHPEVQSGYCLTIGTTQGITAKVSNHVSDFQGLRVVSPAGNVFTPEEFATPLNVEQLLTYARSGKFYAYCAGVAAYMVGKYRIGNATIQNTTTNLPIKKGLSSSAAISVLTARAFNQLYNLGLSIQDEMECAYQGEILTGSQCGRMDQICAFGQVPSLLTFDGNAMHIETLTPQAPLYLIIVDLQASKNTRKILADLNAAFSDETSPLNSNIRDALGPQNARITQHARAAITTGDSATLGALMHEAQAIFDHQIAPACPGELTAPKLHTVLQYPFVRELSWGGKGVGSQGDGCAQLVARDRQAQQELITKLPMLLNVSCFELTIKSDGNLATGAHNP